MLATPRGKLDANLLRGTLLDVRGALQGGGLSDTARRNLTALYNLMYARGVGGKLVDLGLNTTQDVQDAAGTRYSPELPGWHDYEAGPNVICTTRQKCTVEDVRDALARFAVPGQDPSKPIRNRGRSRVYAPGTRIVVGWVRSSFGLGGLAVKNVTLPGHVFFDGQAVRTLEQDSSGAWTILTRGIGNDVVPGMATVNEWSGRPIFDRLDRNMSNYLKSHKKNSASSWEPSRSLAKAAMGAMVAGALLLPLQGCGDGPLHEEGPADHGFVVTLPESDYSALLSIVSQFAKDRKLKMAYGFKSPDGKEFLLEMWSKEISIVVGNGVDAGTMDISSYTNHHKPDKTKQDMIDLTARVATISGVKIKTDY